MKFCKAILLSLAVVSISARTVPAQEDWDEVNYQNYETVETYLPPAYPLEHVDVFQPPPKENRYVEYIPQEPLAIPNYYTEYIQQPPIEERFVEYIPQDPIAQEYVEWVQPEPYPVSSTEWK